jgi:hypothetical protein
MTPPRIAPAAPPITAPFTLSRLVAAPMIAPAAAPIAASRFVCFTVRVRGSAGAVEAADVPADELRSTSPALDDVVVVERRRAVAVLRRAGAEAVRCAAAAAGAAAAAYGAAATPVRSIVETVSTYGAGGSCDAVVRSRLSALSAVAVRSPRPHAVPATAATIRPILEIRCIVPPVWSVLRSPVQGSRRARG